MEVDHDQQVVHTEQLSLALHEPEALLAAMRPSAEHVASRLTSPIVSTHLDTRNVAFERSVAAASGLPLGGGSSWWVAVWVRGLCCVLFLDCSWGRSWTP